jgi:hypothetical protein
MGGAIDNILCIVMIVSVKDSLFCKKKKAHEDKKKQIIYKKQKK